MSKIITTVKEVSINPLDPDADPNVQTKTKEEDIPDSPTAEPAIIRQSDAETSVM